MNKFYVYMLYRDEAKTDPFYVGKGKGGRLTAHETVCIRSRGVNASKNASLRKRLHELGYVPKEIFANHLSEDEAFVVEEWLINFFGRRDNKTGCLTNMTNGGEGTTGFSPSDETRKKLSRAKIGNKNALGMRHTEEFKSNLRLSMIGNKRAGTIGHPHTEESKRKIGAAHLGRKHTEETKNKLSLARSGKQLSNEHKLKIRDYQSSHPPTPEMRQKMSIASRKYWDQKRGVSS